MQNDLRSANNKMSTFPHLVILEKAREATRKRPSCSPVYKPSTAGDFPKLGVSTLYELFIRSCKLFPRNKCLGTRAVVADCDGEAGPFEFKSYQEVGKLVTQIASGMKALGAKPRDRICILGANCPQYMVAMQACNRMSMLCVPLFDNLRDGHLEYIINHSEAKAIFVSTDQLASMVNVLSETKETQKEIIYWGPGNEVSIQAIKELGYQIYSFEELQRLGASKPADPVPPSPDDLCTIMYTSGTTGDPKGVMLKHSAVIAAIHTCNHVCVTNNVTFTDEDAMLSHLPLALISERVFEEWFLYMGGSIGYWQGDAVSLFDDVAALQPAILLGIPHTFDRLCSRIMKQVNAQAYGAIPFLQSHLFNIAYYTKLFMLNRGWKQSHASPLSDYWVFKKISAALGGKIKIVISSGAPLAPSTEEFLRTTLCAPIIQGYGLTETCLTTAIALPDVLSHWNTVGPPTPCTEIRLESVPEMNYDALDPEEPKGEVLIRSAANFSGYYKDQKKTDEELEKDGWFHSGDIAMLTKSGTLKLLGRKTNILKLSQGECIELERLEAIYKKNSFVDQVWIYGNSSENFIVAIVVPSRNMLMSWAVKQGMETATTGSFAEVCAAPEYRAHLLKELIATGRSARLKRSEIIKSVHLTPTLFSVQDDLLTPSLRLKRLQLQRKYQKVLDRMFGQTKKEVKKT